MDLEIEFISNSFAKLYNYSSVLDRTTVEWKVDPWIREVAETFLAQRRSDVADPVLSMTIAMYDAEDCVGDIEKCLLFTEAFDQRCSNRLHQGRWELFDQDLFQLFRQIVNKREGLLTSVSCSSNGILNSTFNSISRARLSFSWRRPATWLYRSSMIWSVLSENSGADALGTLETYSCWNVFTSWSSIMFTSFSWREVMNSLSLATSSFSVMFSSISSLHFDSRVPI